MSKRNRNTLKNYFTKGALPSTEHFNDLIDSSLNMVDEGFAKSPANGFQITSHANHANLVTFYKGNNPDNATWSLSHATDNQNLLFKPRAQNTDEDTPTPSLTLSPEGKTGINTQAPQYELDVQGIIRAEGRIGCNPGESAIPADGKWHAITTTLNGCQAFEVMAGTGKPRTGRYTLLHAIAVNVYNPTGFLFNLFNLKKRIRYTQSYYKSRADKLKLRWRGGKEGYRLEMRSNTSYGEGIYIRFYLTKLWHDPFMAACLEECKE